MSDRHPPLASASAHTLSHRIESLRLTSLLITTFSALALAAPAPSAGIPIRVTIYGEVEYNAVAAAPLGNANPGDAARITFLVDSDTFVNGPTFPTRGYAIDKTSYRLIFPSAVLGLQNPFPGGQTPYFVIRNNDPGVDGFMVSTNVENPVGVPLNQNGGFGPFNQSTYVTYGPDLLPSLDILDALGSYDFTGLTVFNWTIDDGPANPTGMIFASMTIAIDGSAFSDEDCALAGVAGEPRLFGLGNLAAGSNNAIELDHAAPSATAGLFLALASTPVPFKGGTLKPVPFFDPTLLTTSGTGTVSIPFVMPAGVPPGTELWVQWAIQDAAAIKGVSLSNAIVGITP